MNAITSRQTARGGVRTNALLRATQRNQRPVFAAFLLAVLFVAFVVLHPRGLSIMVTTPAANQGLALAFAAMAQTLPVLTGGLDLSVGSVPRLPTVPPRIWSAGRRHRSWPASR
jgi:ribose/xylose/arabinose/galactoside ABC-type transport system permease subunit